MKHKRTISDGAATSITSVSAGGLFGQLLAFQFAGWLEELHDRPIAELRIVEAGAHDGRLAADILNMAAIQSPGTFCAA